MLSVVCLPYHYTNEALYLLYMYTIHTRTCIGQFDQVITKELPCIKGALELLGLVIILLSYIDIMIVIVTYVLFIYIRCHMIGIKKVK